MIHILAKIRHDCLGSIDLRTWEHLGGNDVALRCNLAHAVECRDSLVEIDVTVEQPVGADDGLGLGVSAGDGHVAARLGGEEDAVDVEIVICRADAAEDGLEEGDGDVFELDVFDLGPVGGKGVEPGLGRVAEFVAIAVGELLIAWEVRVSMDDYVTIPEESQMILPTARPVPTPERMPDW